MHSILAKDFQRKKRKTHKPITNKNTHKHRQVTLHTNEKGKAGPWVPSLENWGGRLKSLLWAQLYSSTSSTAIIVSIGRIIEAHSQFQVISSRLVEGFGEIWRIVEKTTCTGGVTVSPIPESVAGVEYVLCTSFPISRIYVSRLTEVIFSNKWWDRYYNTCSITWAV